MPTRIAKVDQEYANRMVRVGQPFHVEPEHVNVLFLMGKLVPEKGEDGYQATDIPAAPLNRQLHVKPHNRKAA